MDRPQVLLDALQDSITSGTSIDTKFYVFSRRDASGRVGSPRPIYCNSRILNTVPYFSILFSEGFSEGQTKDLNEGYPSDFDPYTNEYDYLSDSDLEDGTSCFEDEEGESNKPEPLQDPSDSDSRQDSPTVAPRNPKTSLQGVSEMEDYPQSDKRLGKVAIIRDMAAVTFGALIYFLYTDKISFVQPSADQGRKLPSESRGGDWKTGKPPYPSAKSIYRLADKYDIPTLKDHAKAHILNNLEYCNIVDEVFSDFSLLFREVLPAQVSQLVNKIKEESTGGTEIVTRRKVQDRIASLSQSQLDRVADVLAMIWDGMLGLLDLPPPRSNSRPPAKSTQPPPPEQHKPGAGEPPNWDRMKLALLKSISTGTFVDVQFYAYNAIRNNLPLDPKPCFTSSIVIKELTPTIMEQTARIDPEAPHLLDELTDDYEPCHDERPETLCKDESYLRYRTEDTTSAENRKVVMLTSAAWETWISLLSYTYKNKITFAPLQDPTRDDYPAADTDSEVVQQQQSSSPRTMYSLATALGIKDIQEKALKDIRSKLTASNIAQEVFSSFAANHKAVIEMEIDFIHNNFQKQNPQLVMEHIQRMASGKASFSATTLSLVYDRLAQKVFPSSVPLSSASTQKDPVPAPDPPSRMQVLMVLLFLLLSFVDFAIEYRNA